MATNTLARAMDQTVFCVEETTKGTAVFPSAAAEMVVGAGTVDINQQPTYTNSEEIVNSLDVINRFRDQVGSGTFSIPIYIRPSGTAGTPPMGKVLFESLMGLETIVSDTSVTYDQATTKPSFTLWVQKDHTVFFGTGACVESGTFNFTNTGGAMGTMTGGFMQLGWAGTATVVGAVAASDQVIVDDAKLFTAGGFVSLGDDTNTNAGYEIESVNVGTNTLTMVDTVSCDDGVAIAGFLPTGFTAVGAPLENKDLTITFDAASKTMKTLDVTINSPVAWQTEEITTSGYVEDYVEDRRNITVNPNVLFREQDMTYFYDAMQGADVAVIATVSDGAGKICTFNFPRVNLEVPNVTTTAPTVSLAINGTALGTAGEDSATIVFT